MSARSKFVLLALALALSSAGASAQGRGPGGGGHGGPGGGGGFPGGSHGGFPNENRGGFPSGDHGSFPGSSRGGYGNVPTHSNAPHPSSHAVVQLGPSGRWWDDKKFSRSVGIDDDTRKRMDNIFSYNKGALSERFKSLQQEEKALGKLVDAREPDEPRILAQIDRVAQARAELEKASARLVLALKRSLTPEQAAKLEAKTRETQEEPEPPPPPQ